MQIFIKNLGRIPEIQNPNKQTNIQTNIQSNTKNEVIFWYYFSCVLYGKAGFVAIFKIQYLGNRWTNFDDSKGKFLSNDV